MKITKPLHKWRVKTEGYSLGVLLLTPFFLATAITLSLLAPPQANALQTTPYTINYQGRLTNASGTAMADGQYNMTFRLYSVLTGGSAVWTEVHDTTNRVTVTNGQFNVQLGSVTALSPSLFTSQPLYFEVELPSPATATCSTAGCASYTEGPMTPRQPLASSAYAMNADTLDGVDSTSFARNDVANTYTNTQLVKTTSTSAFAVQQTGGASALTVNTTNQRVAVGDVSTPAATLSVQSASGETLPALVVNNVGTGSIAQFQNGGTSVLTIASTGTTISTTSTTAFTIQKAAAADTLFTADSSNNRIVVGNATGTDTATTLFVLDSATADPTTGVVNGAMYYNSSLGKFRCYQGGAFTNCIGSGSGSSSQQVTLVPEYAGAVLSANGAANNNINVTSSAVSGLVSTQGYKHNFYQWNTTATTSQQYSIVVNYQLPSNFTSFVSGSFNLWTYADATAGAGATFTLLDKAGNTCVSAASVVPTAAATWQDKLPGDPTSCTFAANDVITMIITPSVTSSTGNLKIGELGFAYQ